MSNENQSPIESAETALVKARPDVEHDPRTVHHHSRHVVVDPLAPVMIRTIPADEVPGASEASMRVDVLERALVEQGRELENERHEVVRLRGRLSAETEALRRENAFVADLQKQLGESGRRIAELEALLTPNAVG